MSLTNNFNKEGTLYHCISVKPEGDTIKPSLGYGTNINLKLRKKLKITGNKKIPLVFAATHFSKSLAFGFNYHDDEILMNGGIEGTDAEFAIIVNRKETMSKDRSITVYSFSNEGFVNLDSSRQSISSKAVPFSKTKIVLEANNAEDLMRAGLQVFSFAQSYSDMKESNFIEKSGIFSECTYKFLEKYIGKGMVIWENKERNINPNPVLAKKINIKLAKKINIKPNCCKQFKPKF